MKTGCFVWMAATATVFAVVSLAPVSAVGQTRRAVAPTWHPPRTLDGQPDIQGFWRTDERTPTATFATYALEGGDLFDKRNSTVTEAFKTQWGRLFEARSVVVDPPSGKIPYQPWALAKRQEYLDGAGASLIDHRVRCLKKSGRRSG